MAVLFDHYDQKNDVIKINDSDFLTFYFNSNRSWNGFDNAHLRSACHSLVMRSKMIIDDGLSDF